MKKHVLEKHAEKTLFPCTKCSFSTNNRTQLKLHTDRIHGERAEVKKHVCFQCQSGFENKKALREHLLIEHNIVFKAQ